MAQKEFNPSLAPTVALINPKYYHNVGGVLRACSCFGGKQLIWTGDRVTLDIKKGERLPREERMKGYQDVEMSRVNDRFFDKLDPDIVPVAVELRKGCENLFDFEHPKKAIYVFGPEDGGLSKTQVMHCHRFLIIPSAHCLNLSSAVGVVLYDRMLKRHWLCEDEPKAPHEYVQEDRGVQNTEILQGISVGGLGKRRRR